jgi:hypothetical protein
LFKKFIRRRSGGMADASDSKSDAGNSVWVQVPSPALTQKSRKHAIFIEKSKVYGFFFLMTASTAATFVSATSAI